ncbi:hypothetical protein NCPPB3778_39 [Rathayibacter phage NCPPB3778]|nr:hypothetical protein NCPPB3778_39 [Rathayibacter phage NCPPB3778]
MTKRTVDKVFKIDTSGMDDDAARDFSVQQISSFLNRAMIKVNRARKVEDAAVDVVTTIFMAALSALILVTIMVLGGWSVMLFLVPLILTGLGVVVATAVGVGVSFYLSRTPMATTLAAIARRQKSEANKGK